MKAEIKTVAILPDIYEKIMFWVDSCDKEISGMGKVTIKDGGYQIIEAYLLEQEVTSTTTDIDAVALGKLMSETIKEEGHLNFWWHSHVNMGTFWSGTDIQTIKDFGKAGFCLATVFNKKRDTRTAYCQGGDDFFTPLFIDDIKLEIARPVNLSKHKQWKKEMDDKVRIPKITLPKNNYMGNGAWRYGRVWCESTRTWVDPITDGNGNKKMPKLKTQTRKERKAEKKKQLELIDENTIGTPWSTLLYDERCEWADCYESYYGMRPPTIFGEEVKAFYNEWKDFGTDCFYGGMI